MKPSDLEPLDAAVLETLLAGNHPVLVALRAQLAEATLESRELSGVGFFTHFTLPPTVAPVPVRCLRFGDVHGTIAGLEYGAGFVLFVDDGRLTMLEGFSYAEPWPVGPITEFSISYLEPGRPKLEAKLRDLPETWPDRRVARDDNSR